MFVVRRLLFVVMAVVVCAFLTLFWLLGFVGVAMRLLYRCCSLMLQRLFVAPGSRFKLWLHILSVMRKFCVDCCYSCIF